MKSFWKIKIIVSFLVTLFFLDLKAQQEIPLYEKNLVPGALSCEVMESRSGQGAGVVKDVTIPTLTVYEPRGSSSENTAVIVCPGGSYVTLSMEGEGAKSAEILTKENIVVFVLKYRTSNFKCNSDYKLAPLQDIQQAILKIRKEARKWKVNPNKVGVMGFSAGGHLAALASTRYNVPQVKNGTTSLRPDFSVLVYPVISFTDSLTSKLSKSRIHLLGEHFTKDEAEWFSSELHVNATTPPTYLIHAADDSIALVGQSLVYYQALNRNKVPSQIMVYQQGGHGFSVYNKPLDDFWTKGVVNWLKLNKLL